MSTVHDMHRWFTNPNGSTSHLEGSAQDGSKVIQHCHDTGKTLCYIKTDNGWPLDMKQYDKDWIYDTTTEYGWTSDRNYKRNGWAMCPRWWDDGRQGLVITHPTAHPQFFTDCKLEKIGDISPVTYSLYGPTGYHFGGDVGLLQTIVLDYTWSGINTEKLYLTREHGWVLWEYWKSGVKQQFSMHNKVASGTCKPMFPCYQVG